MNSVLKKFSAPALVASLALVVTACGGGGGGGEANTIPPGPVPSQPPLGTTCLAPGQSAGRSPQSLGILGEAVRVAPQSSSASYVPGQLAIQYRPSQTSAVTRGVQGLSARSEIIKDFDFGNAGLATRIIRVDPAQLDATAAALRTQSGVLRVDRVAYRYAQTATPLLTNDPYFSQPVPPNPPTGYVRPTAPYYESASVPGQWDMHVIGLENAFGYSTPSNSLGRAVPAALGGSPSVRLAVIDTGMDLTQPDLAGGRAVRTECFLTPSSGPQTNTTNVSDFDGHGTNVTSLAASSLNNGYFAAPAGNVGLMLYRVFPSGASAAASVVDEATAINDAVANGAKVISLSLGSSTPDATEQTSIANAIAAGVTVVAASGNESRSSALDYPAAYPGVVAVGASALDDTIPVSIVEKVASYSNYVSGSTTWGLVAPGGDPSGGSDGDDLHWIEGSYSIRAPAPNNCSNSPDFFSEANNCRVLIAGTSQATPHVAGAVALLLSVAGPMSPAAVKAALFASAHDIGQGSKQGAGRLNVYRLLATALGDPSPPPP